MSAPTVNWESFEQAREEIDLMPLTELGGVMGLVSPRLLPFPGPAFALGVVLVLVGAVQGAAWQLLGLAVGLYGVIGLTVNRSRANGFRLKCYRTFVQRRALEMAEEAEAADG